MQPLLLRTFLARELMTLYHEGYEEKNPGTRFLNVLAWAYQPEDMSDTESQTVWTAVVLLSLQYGVTTADYEHLLGVDAVQLQQWMRGESQPHGTRRRKDLYHMIGDLVRIKQSTG